MRVAKALCGFFGLAVLLLTAHTAAAQTGKRERISIGLSTDTISITSGFAGADLTIFGALDNTDPEISAEGGYDVIVVLQGPPRTVVVRRKSRVLGVWINTSSETFVNVPASYSMALSRNPQDITDAKTYRQLSLGPAYIYMEPLHRDADPQRTKEFANALRDRKKAEGLYTERVGAVQFLSGNLFRASVALAPDVPVGIHRARAYLFRRGAFVSETSTGLVIVKSGVEQSVYRFAHDNGLAYGLFAVALAIVTGWGGRFISRRDR